MNFDQAPMLVIWEATQACDLACVHCRASAQSERSATELTTEQGYRLLDEIRSFGEPLMVFTGGDPLKRPDLFDLIRYSVKIGLRTNVTPAPLRCSPRKPSTNSRKPACRVWRSAWTATMPLRTTISAASPAPSIAPCSRWPTHAISASIPSSRPR